MGLTQNLTKSFLVIFSIITIFSTFSQTKAEHPELKPLLDLKSTIDPKNTYLSSWKVNGEPCDGTFEGLACNELGHVVNISLQGKSLNGRLSSSIGQLKHLTGLYLHYNNLYGEIPSEIAGLADLSDLYLNVNNLSGQIPVELGDMPNLQVLQLCYNQITGSIPTQLGALKKLSVLALQSNQLTGAIPASLGNLATLTRLDLSFNHLFGSIPTKVAEAPLLQVLDVRNNSLSGSVPPGLKKMNEGFQYQNNRGLCGVGFISLNLCELSTTANPGRPEPYGPGDSTKRQIPETANVHIPCNQTRCSSPSKKAQSSVAIGIVVLTLALSAIAVLMFVQYRRRKQKLGSSFDVDQRVSTDQARDVYKKKGSPLISLEYSNSWDPLANGKNLGAFSKEVLQSFRLNLEEIESATQYFSELNLLGKSSFSAMYKGILRDGSVVAIKCISKTSCKSDEPEFLKGLHTLTSLRHENLVRLRGFCCSRGRGECFLVYEFVPKGNLLRFLDMKEGDGPILDWATRVSIINGIAKGIEYLHKVKSPALVHQNISAEKVLIDNRFNPLLSSSCLHKLLANDIVFSALKASAAMGYLAPEYTTTGRFTEKSDIYAFGILVLQILSGKRIVNGSVRVGAESFTFEDFIDPNLDGNFERLEALKIAKLALECTHESPYERPSMERVIQELGTC